MNSKKIACLVLIMIIAGIVYGTQIMQHRATDRAQEANNAKTDYESARATREISENELAKLKQDTQELHQFLSSWEPIIGRMTTGQEAEQALMGIVRNSGILTVSQKFEVKENRNGGLIPKSVIGSLIVQDEYAKTLNWLGELERKLPLARLTSCRIKQGENGGQINLEVHFDIPLIDLKAEIEPPNKK